GLGASVYGRIEPVSKFDKVYAGDRRGGTALNGRPRARRSAVSALGADHTLDDSTSPDLFRAARDIAGEANPTARRRRAIALLDSIRAGWRNQYARESRVQAASAYFAWGVRGDVRALWLWELGRVRWIDNADGEPMAPQELKLRTPSNLTFHGDDPSALIHPDFEGSDAQTLREVGVAGEPNPPELLDALSTIRDSDTPDATKFSQSLGIYAALGDWIVSSDAAPGERRQVTEEFLNEPLIFTGVEWFTSKNAFRGEPIFREYRNFAPPGSDQIEALWRSINLPTPDVLDCANVLIEIADSGPLTEEVVPVVVEILRYAERSDIPAPTPHTVKKWKTLPVWTGSNWSVKRPIYAVGNTLLAEAVAGKVATWKPQVDIEQFSGVPEMLGLTQLSENAVTVTADGDFDPDATDAFSEVVSALHSDLALNNAELFRSLSLPWDDLAKVSVHVSTQIVATITLEQRTFEAPISAWLDRTNLQLHVGKEHSVLESADVAIAVAALFKSAARTAEDSWFRASRTIEKTSGPSKRQVTTSLEIDSKQRQTNVEKAKQALGGLLDSVGNPPKIRGNRKRAGARELDVGTQPDPETKPAKRRVLIDPDEWAFTSTDGKFIEGKAPPRAKPKKPQ
ncbi:MAG TPA: hypothetical protein VL068_13775, partial [Microthrixaceae bacterium]|nr:hypothetical protein [Microthrixaceae bacterium]